MIPTDPHELNLVAGEYVLGVLDAAEASEIEAALASGGNAALRVAVAFWEERLHGLTGTIDPAAPPPELWGGIEARLDAEKASEAAAGGLWHSLSFWRGSAATAVAAAAALAFYIAAAPAPVPSPAPVPNYVAVLQPTQQQPMPAWLVRTAGREGLVLTTLASPSVAPDRSLELWAVRPGAAPVSLGVLPADGQFEINAHVPLREGLQLAISLEPRGGSPTGSPTGPVLFAGELRRQP